MNFGFSGFLVPLDAIRNMPDFVYRYSVVGSFALGPDWPFKKGDIYEFLQGMRCAPVYQSQIFSGYSVMPKQPRQRLLPHVCVTVSITRLPGSLAFKVLSKRPIEVFAGSRTE